jgi:signal transduction histidine kinase
VKYGRDGGVIRLHIEVDNGLIHLTVWNEGPGFARSERTKLFRKFVRLGDPELKKEKGTGLGLYSTWRIMQLHRGRVTARSEQGAWAEFSLSFPVRQSDDRTTT